MIWKQFTHLGNFPPELKSRYNSFLTTEFDDSLSVEMQLRSVIKWCQENFNTVDTLIDFINDISNWLKQFETDFGEKLGERVISVLSEWQESGYINVVISEALDWELKDYKLTNDSRIDSLETNLATEMEDLETNLNTQMENLNNEVDTSISALRFQLEQTLVEVIDQSFPLNSIIRTSGFREVNEGTLNFRIQSVEPTDNWVDVDGILYNKELEIKLSEEVKACPIYTSVYNVKYVGLLRNQPTLLQMVFDFVSDKNITVDFDGREVEINQTHWLNKSQYPRKVAVIKNGTFYLKTRLGFDTTDTSNSGGGYRFYNCNFIGIKGSPNALFDSKLIRMYFDRCDYYDIGSALLSSENQYFAQTVYYNNCTVVGGEGYFFQSHNAYDILFTNSVMEHRDAGFFVNTPHSVRITDNVIEGIEREVYKGSAGRSLVIDNNYFEHNGRGADTPSFLFKNYSGGANHFNVSFQGNLVHGTDTQKSNPSYYHVQFDGMPNTFTCEGTWSDTNLFKCLRAYTVSNKMLRQCLKAQVQGTGMKVINEWGMNDIQEGSGSLVQLQSNPDLSVYTTTGTVKSIQMGVLMTGNSSFIANTGVPTIVYSYYVLGVLLSTGSTSSTGELTFIIRNLGGSEIWRHSILLSHISTNMNFLSLPPFRTTNDSRSTLEVILNSDPSYSVTIKNLVFQQGTVANPYQYR